MNMTKDEMFKAALEMKVQLDEMAAGVLRYHAENERLRMQLKIAREGLEDARQTLWDNECLKSSERIEAYVEQLDTLERQ